MRRAGAQACKAVGFIHIAAHGLAHPESPGLSGVLLSAETGLSGFVRLLDVMGLKLRSEIVVLSACETLLGKPTSGEGYQGLVRGFLYAGAENVIASRWRVPDRASAGLLPAVYRGLLWDGLSPGDALRKAQLGYLEAVPDASPELASPYFWGAWTAWGSGAAGSP